MPYGIEIEVEKVKPKHVALHLWNQKFPHRDWYIKDDGSLDEGSELVSGVMPYSYLARDQAIDLMEELRRAGAKPHSKSCSVHIHVSPDDGINKAAWVVWFARNALAHDEAIAKRFTRKDRRERWAMPCTDHHKVYAALDPTRVTMDDIKRVNYRDRYWGVNIGAAISRHGTIELRYFDGTKRKNDIYRYVEIARTLNYHAMAGTIADESELLLDDETYKASFAKRPVTPDAKKTREPDPYEGHLGYPGMASLSMDTERALIGRIIRLLEANPTWDFNMDEVDLLGRHGAYLIKAFVKIYGESKRAHDAAQVYLGQITSSTTNSFDCRMHAQAEPFKRVMKRTRKALGVSPSGDTPNGTMEANALTYLRRFCIRNSPILSAFLPPVYTKPLPPSAKPLFVPDPDDMPCTCDNCQRSIRKHYTVR